jgi:alpha-tubulin suppressor-like RCC1 family protein
MNELINTSEWNGKGKRRPWMRGLNIAAAILAVAGAGLAQAQTPNVVGWGNNAYGQISPPASLTDAKAIAAGFGHSLALKGNGTVVAWGIQLRRPNQRAGRTCAERRDRNAVRVHRVGR